MTEHFYRSSATLFSASVLLLMSAISIIGCIAAVASKSSGGSLVAAVLGLVFGVSLLAWSVLVVVRMGVIARESGLEVRGWLKRRNVSWGNVEGFRFGNELKNLTLREACSTPVLTTYIVLRDGNHVPMPGLSATRVNRKRSREKVSEILRELDDERRNFTQSPRPSCE